MRTYCIAQETLLNALLCPKWKANPKERGYRYIHGLTGDSVVKNLPAIQEMWVLSLDQEDPLEKEMSTRSSILAWEIPWTEDSGGLQTMWSQKNQTQLSDQTTYISVIANSFCYEIKANATL